MALLSSLLCLLLVLAASTSQEAEEPLQWWQAGIIYQIYPRSFRDSDGDGVGDLKGVTEKLDHLVEAGVTGVWLSPFFKSPMVDNGYDISDFTDVDPVFGTMEDFDELLAQAHDKGLKILMDFVPNHSSDEHEWFQKSSNISDPEYDKYEDYYVWLEGKVGEDGVTPEPPNNWANLFNGESAWEWNNDRQQYYLHQFHKAQPDLNYNNTEVVEGMKDFMRFWLEKGVDGFRMDAVPHLFEDGLFRDEEEVDGGLTSRYTKHQDGTYDMVRQWREVVEAFGTDKLMMTEAYGTYEEVVRYYGNDSSPGAHFSFNFVFITDVNNQSDATTFKSAVDDWLEATVNQGLWSNWVIGNHDQPRVASRYSPELVDGMNMLVTLLPGTAVTYNGEEIGMEDNYDMTCDVAHDPQGCHDGVTLGRSRDPCRTPFQWDNTTSAGFSSNETTWLPVHENYETLNLEAQKAAERSHFKVYQKLAAARKQRVVQRGVTETFALGSVFAFTRTLAGEDSLLVAVNLGTENQSVDLKAMLPLAHHFTVLTSSVSSPLTEGSTVGSLTLGPHESVVLQASGERGAAGALGATALLCATLVAAVLAAGHCAGGARRGASGGAPPGMAPAAIVPLPLLLALSLPLLAAGEALRWWQTGVVYQVYPKSFKDSDANGVGDIKGITSKLSHLTDMGVAGVWISPVYPSPMKDNGYDISDFKGIDPTFGTMEDLDELLNKAHAVGLKVLMDFVPNHCSEEHEWFQKATNTSHPEHAKYREYFVWHPGVAKDNASQPDVPNNWESWFGGSMWTWHEELQMYYLHQFGPYQPDLNFNNPEVVEEMKDVVRFWLNKGVDGFRMDAIPHLFENESYADEEWAGQYTKHHPKTYEMVQQWRALLDSVNSEAVMVTECYGSMDEIAGYYGNATNPGAHFSFNFQLVYVEAQNSASDVKNTIDVWIDGAKRLNLWSNWVAGNHDKSRVASRVGVELVDGMNMLLMLLPGTAISYNGEEIGMEDYRDFQTSEERDYERTPYQWDNSTSAGFSDNAKTWLPVNPNYVTLNLAAQKAAERSHYHVYQQLVRMREEAIVQQGDVSTAALGSALAVARVTQGANPLFVLVNFGSGTTTVNLNDGFSSITTENVNVSITSVKSSHKEGELLRSTAVELAGYEAVVLRGVPSGGVEVDVDVGANGDDPQAGAIAGADDSEKPTDDKGGAAFSPSASAAALLPTLLVAARRA
ncbi:uncharacterized protein LOC126230929 [Schistocerca nitens]|uniref:uncharacterized protein LOC126230929 n=1 Tax=Schistocerca nitens TaxID=7011 RepID=UPI0021196010|nr:uncharacterized protein LOC126230929 [Schistocerca nitens]